VRETLRSAGEAGFPGAGTFEHPEVMLDVREF
jgi:hypothetical protein